MWGTGATRAPHRRSTTITTRGTGPMQRSGRLAVHDEGFTLIEVVVALFLLGIVAAAGLTFFIRGMQNTSNLARTQVAVGVANQAMETVRSAYPREVDTVNHVNGLIYG